MNNNKNTVLKRLIFGCVIAVALFASAGKLRANTEETIDKTFTVASGGTVVTDVDWGSIEVKTHPGNDVTIHVWRKVARNDKAEEERFLRERPVVISLDGEIVTIRSHREIKGKQSLNAGKQRTEGKYTITVPAKFNVRLKTSGGGIAVGDLAGEVKTQTSGGALKFTHIRGPVDGHTSGGGIQASDCEGTLKVNTSGGGVTIKDAVGKVDVRTSGGSILASFSSPFSDDVRLATSGGDVTMRVAANSAFNLEASTSGGGVNSEVPVASIGRIGRHQLKGTVNGGGKSVMLHTSGGSIHLKKL